MLREGLKLCDCAIYQFNGCDAEFNNKDILITALFIIVKN